MGGVVADFDQIDAGGQCLVTYGAAHHVKDLHRLSVGTFDYDAATAGIDLDVVGGDVVDAVAVGDYLGEILPAVSITIGLLGAAGDDENTASSGEGWPLGVLAVATEGRHSGGYPHGVDGIAAAERSGLDLLKSGGQMDASQRGAEAEGLAPNDPESFGEVDAFE